MRPSCSKGWGVVFGTMPPKHKSFRGPSWRQNLAANLAPSQNLGFALRAGFSAGALLYSGIVVAQYIVVAPAANLVR
jgi:hypothetical protein